MTASYPPPELDASVRFYTKLREVLELPNAELERLSRLVDAEKFYRTVNNVTIK